MSVYPKKYIHVQSVCSGCATSKRIIKSQIHNSFARIIVNVKQSRLGSQNFKYFQSSPESSRLVAQVPENTILVEAPQHVDATSNRKKSVFHLHSYKHIICKMIFAVKCSRVDRIPRSPQCSMDYQI